LNGFKTTMVFVSQLFVGLFSLGIFSPKGLVIESFAT